MISGSIKIILAILLSATLSGCVSSDVSDSKDSNGESTVETDTSEIEDNTDISSNETDTSDIQEDYLDRAKETAIGVNKLTKEFIKEIKEDKGVISGFSGYSALATVEDWTDGKTKDEIEKSVGKIDDEVLEHCKMVLPIETSTLFLIDDELKLNTQDRSKFVFEDLQSEQIVGKINQYVADKTHKMITEMIKEPFMELTRAVVLDTLYFKGNWVYEFDANNTVKDTFYGKNNETEVDFMHATEKYNVNTEDKVVELKYKEGNMVMDILYDVEDVDDRFNKYINDMETNNLNLNNKTDVILSLPKFEVETTINITDCYKNMGINDLFTLGANIDKLANDIYVNTIIQKAKVRVDEKGTEAAAVTMVIMTDNCIEIEEEEPIVVNVNKPFIYVIRDTETNMILFAGFINNF